jgi:hypothetical protein
LAGLEAACPVLGERGAALGARAPQLPQQLAPPSSSAQALSGRPLLMPPPRLTPSPPCPPLQVTRGKATVHTGELVSLRRIKDDVEEVSAGGWPRPWPLARPPWPAVRLAQRPPAPAAGRRDWSRTQPAP